MDESYKYNKRHGIKVPRSTLLPPYMSSNPYFVEFTDAMDAIYGPTVDSKLSVLSNIRNMWVQNLDTEVAAETGVMMPPTTWSTPERPLVVKQVNMLGMKLENAGIVTDDAYQTIARFVGMYWFGKGTAGFIDFINYCLSSDLKVENQWTDDYVTFWPEGSHNIGVPIWEGGTWYPTTHVVVAAEGGLRGLDIVTLQKFFYEIANYNLVLLAIDQRFDMPIVARPGDDGTIVMAVGLFCDNNVPISTASA